MEARAARKVQRECAATLRRLYVLYDRARRSSSRRGRPVEGRRPARVAAGGHDAGDLAVVLDDSAHPSRHAAQHAPALVAATENAAPPTQAAAGLLARPAPPWPAPELARSDAAKDVEISCCVMRSPCCPTQPAPEG